MMSQDIFSRELPKWPALVVVGEPVTPEQAAEIILRTDSLFFSGDDSMLRNQLNSYLYDVEITESDRYNALELAVAEKLGVEAAGSGYNQIWEYENAKQVEVGQIQLNYLQNDRILSSWIGGAHGWCDWDGKIGCSNYNIGKWPSIREVYEDWVEIAREWPFLDLRCQLMNHEAGEEQEGAGPVVEFIVKNGTVEAVEPTETLVQPSFVSPVYDLMPLVYSYNEAGCTFTQFKNAVDACRAKHKETV